MQIRRQVSRFKVEIWGRQLYFSTKTEMCTVEFTALEDALQSVYKRDSRESKYAVPTNLR